MHIYIYACKQPYIHLFDLSLVVHLCVYKGLHLLCSRKSRNTHKYINKNIYIFIYANLVCYPLCPGILCPHGLRTCHGLYTCRCWGTLAGIDLETSFRWYIYKTAKWGVLFMSQSITLQKIKDILNLSYNQIDISNGACAVLNNIVKKTIRMWRLPCGIGWHLSEPKEPSSASASARPKEPCLFCLVNTHNMLYILTWWMKESSTPCRFVTQLIYPRSPAAGALQPTVQAWAER
jgi:hypothetical protein